MGAELGRLRSGEKTKTGMSEEQLGDFAKKPLAKENEHLHESISKEDISKIPYEKRPEKYGWMTPETWKKTQMESTGADSAAYMNNKKVSKSIYDFVEKSKNSSLGAAINRAEHMRGKERKKPGSTTIPLADWEKDDLGRGRPHRQGAPPETKMEKANSSGSVDDYDESPAKEKPTKEELDREFPHIKAKDMLDYKMEKEVDFKDNWPKYPYHCGECNKRVDSAGSVPKAAGVCNDCYHKKKSEVKKGGIKTGTEWGGGAAGWIAGESLGGPLGGAVGAGLGAAGGAKLGEWLERRREEKRNKNLPRSKPAFNYTERNELEDDQETEKAMDSLLNEIETKQLDFSKSLYNIDNLDDLTKAQSELTFMKAYDLVQDEILKENLPSDKKIAWDKLSAIQQAQLKKLRPDLFIKKSMEDDEKSILSDEQDTKKLHDEFIQTAKKIREKLRKDVEKQDDGEFRAMKDIIRDGIKESKKQRCPHCGSVLTNDVKDNWCPRCHESCDKKTNTRISKDWNDTPLPPNTNPDDLNPIKRISSAIKNHKQKHPTEEQKRLHWDDMEQDRRLGKSAELPESYLKSERNECHGCGHVEGVSKMEKAFKDEGSPCGSNGCKGHYEFSRSCGALVCDTCDDHKGLSRCYCGWSKSSPGKGRQELEEMGETIDEEKMEKAKSNFTNEPCPSCQSRNTELNKHADVLGEDRPMHCKNCDKYFMSSAKGPQENISKSLSKQIMNFVEKQVQKPAKP